MRFLLSVFVFGFVSMPAFAGIDHTLIKCYETPFQRAANIRFVFEVFENHRSVLPRLGLPWTQDLLGEIETEEPSGVSRGALISGFDSNPRMTFKRNDPRNINGYVPVRVEFIEEDSEDQIVYCQRGISTWVFGIFPD